jgi:hypothetical protein
MSSQLLELGIAYAVTATAMLLALLLRRAAPRLYLRWPAYSVMVMALGVVGWNLMRKHVFPVEWLFAYPRAMYFAALGIYALLGALAGLGLAQVTRTKTETGTFPQ